MFQTSLNYKISNLVSLQKHVSIHRRNSRYRNRNRIRNRLNRHQTRSVSRNSTNVHHNVNSSVIPVLMKWNCILFLIYENKSFILEVFVKLVNQFQKNRFEVEKYRILENHLFFKCYLRAFSLITKTLLIKKIFACYFVNKTVIEIPFIIYRIF